MSEEEQSIEEVQDTENVEEEEVEKEEEEEEEEEIPENAISLRDPDLDYKEGHGFYKGSFSDDRRRSGYGSYYFILGARYTGQWRNGMKHGLGTFFYPDGSKYSGQWRNDVKHGCGVYSYSNGDTHDGEWYLDLRHGSGVYYHAESKSFYRGFWRDGKLHGPTQITMNDLRFSSTFYNGVPRGPATFTLPNNLVVRGKYVYQKDLQTSVWVTRGLGKAFP